MPVEQAESHEPQWAGSFASAAQPSLHAVCVGGQEHTPPTQA
jgi:hypothetical protein